MLSTIEVDLPSWNWVVELIVWFQTSELWDTVTPFLLPLFPPPSQLDLLSVLLSPFMSHSSLMGPTIFRPPSVFPDTVQPLEEAIAFDCTWSVTFITSNTVVGVIKWHKLSLKSFWVPQYVSRWHHQCEPMVIKVMLAATDYHPNRFLRRLLSYLNHPTQARGAEVQLTVGCQVWAKRASNNGRFILYVWKLFVPKTLIECLIFPGTANHTGMMMPLSLWSILSEKPRAYPWFIFPFIAIDCSDCKNHSFIKAGLAAFVLVQVKFTKCSFVTHSRGSRSLPVSFLHHCWG